MLTLMFNQISNKLDVKIVNQYLGIMEELFNGKSKKSVSNRK